MASRFTIHPYTHGKYFAIHLLLIRSLKEKKKRKYIFAIHLYYLDVSFSMNPKLLNVNVMGKAMGFMSVFCFYFFNYVKTFFLDNC